MKRLVLGAAILLGLAACGLSACAELSADLAAANTGTTAAVQTVATQCAKYAPLINAVAATAPDPTSALGVVLADAQSTCTADGTVASTIAPNLNADTGTWATNLLADLKMAAEIAGVVAPLL
jgi:hypothetical protein